MSRIDAIVDGDHCQGTFRFPMKLLFVMKSEKMLNVQVVLLRFNDKQINRDILKNTIIDKLQDSFKLVLEPITIDNHQVSIDNIYVTRDLAFLVILLGKELTSPKWRFK